MTLPRSISYLANRLGGIMSLNHAEGAMMKVTLELPEPLARSLQGADEHLPRILELGVRAWAAVGEPEYDGVADVLETLARLPAPTEVLALRPSPALQGRIEALLEKNRTTGLDPAEQREWQSYQYLEHLVRLAKANALAKLRAPDSP
jgi:hypothetical protein